ncbi:MAG: OsmC family protein [Pseudomonadota bacterium]
MNVIMHRSEDIELRHFDEPGLNIEQLDPEAHYSAMQMFATAMGLCTYSVLAGYAELLDTPTEQLSLRMHWNYEEAPYRIGRFDMEIQWPELPPSRQSAAERVASKCTLHNTLEHPPQLTTRVKTSAA